MSGAIQCFMLEPTEIAAEYLRRYVQVTYGDCSAGTGYHNARSEIGQVAYDAKRIHGDNFNREDERWPLRCACGYVFRWDDEWQHGAEQLYRRSDTAELCTLRDAPPGAMWYAPWYEQVYKGPDGRCLVVRTPCGDWIPDAESANGGKPWDRTGVPPLVTVTPSILINSGKRSYHGWLRAGQLVEA